MIVWVAGSPLTLTLATGTPCYPWRVPVAAYLRPAR